MSAGGRVENLPDTTNMQMGMLVVSGGRNVARQENVSHLGTHFRDWLEGGGGESADTTNVPK